MVDFCAEKPDPYGFWEHPVHLGPGRMVPNPIAACLYSLPIAARLYALPGGMALRGASN